MDLLVTTDWLAGELGKPDLRVVDATLVLPEHKRDAKAEFEAAHIPGAVFLDLDEVADTASPYPTMLPSPEKFASRMQALGIGDGSRVVVYDDSPFRSACRAWWMLNVFGAHEVAVLDGGFAKWRAENRKLESGKPIIRHRHFTVFEDMAGVKSLNDVLTHLRLGDAQLVDARSPGRFAGSEPEPRPGVRSGHMPGAKNVHYSRLLNADGTFKSVDELKAVFAEAGVSLDKPIVTTCGSGITAATVLFALALAGHPEATLYDGSWAEYGAQGSTPVVTGA
jgi:thiosulfate/3-mercaptopyruvate sulfurtransferase